MDIQFVTFDKKFLDLSWKWLNDKENKFLTNAPNISKEQQLEWFNGLNTRTDYYIWGIIVDNQPIGAAGFKRIVNSTAHIFWYIGEKDYWGKRIGVTIASKISELGKQRGLKELLGEPIFENIRSINLLFKEGYKIVDINLEERFYLLKKQL